MKKIIWVLFLFFFTGLIYSQSSLKTGLVSYYNASETYNDVHGTNEGTTHGVVFARGISEVNNYFYEFDNVNDYIALTTPYTYSTGTWNFWVMPYSFPDDQIIFGNNFYYSRIFIGVSNNTKLETNTNGQEFGQYTAYTEDVWYMVTLVRSGDNVVFYRNGSYQTTVTITGANAITISQIGFNGRSLIGRLDEIGVWNRALTTAEVDTLWNGPDGVGGEGYFYPFFTGGAPPTLHKMTLLNGKPRKTLLANIIRYKAGTHEEFSGNTIYKDPIDGNDANNGSSSSYPVATYARVQELLTSSTDYIALSDTIHYGSLNISSISRNYGDHLTVTTWHKYGTGNAKVKGLTDVSSTWAQDGNIWTKELTGMPIVNSVIYPGYVYMTSHLNGIYINGSYHTISKSPNTSTFYSFESGGTGYLKDNQGIASDNYWNNGYIVCQSPEWVNTKLKISDYASDGTYTYTEKNEEELYDALGYGYPGIKYFLINHRNAADINGEWLRNYTTGRLEVFYNTNFNVQTVFAPLVDTVFNIINSSHITVEEIDFYGANKEQIKIENSTGININDCNFYRSPFAGVGIFNSDTVSVTNSNFHYPNDNGIFGLFNDYSVYTDNYLHDVGVDGTFGGDRRGWHLVGIITAFDYGDVIIERNEIDSTGYNGTSELTDGDWVAQADVDYLVKNNYINASMSLLADGAGIYCTGAFKVGPSKIVRGNIITNTHGNPFYHQLGRVDNTFGIYHDYNSHNWIVDSNYIDNIETAFLCQYDNGNFQYKRNVISNINGTDILPNYGFLEKNDAHYDSVRFVKNDVVVYSPMAAHTGDMTFNMYLNNLAGFSELENFFDSTDYYNPFRVADSSWIVGSGAPSWTFTARNLAYIRGLTTDWEDHSTWNKTGWTFGDVSGIAKSQFINFFVNFSSSAHSFVFGANEFYDLDGNIATGNYSVPAYSAKVLFYKSGNYTGSKIYNP